MDIVSKAKDFISNQVGVNVSTGAPTRKYMPRSQQADKNSSMVGKSRGSNLKENQEAATAKERLDKQRLRLAQTQGKTTTKTRRMREGRS